VTIHFILQDARQRASSVQLTLRFAKCVRWVMVSTKLKTLHAAFLMLLTWGR